MGKLNCVVLYNKHSHQLVQLVLADDVGFNVEVNLEKFPDILCNILRENKLEYSVNTHESHQIQPAPIHSIVEVDLKGWKIVLAKYIINQVMFSWPTGLLCRQHKPCLKDKAVLRLF